MRCSEIMDILEIVRLSELGLTHREIATSVKCGKTTVGDVKKRCSDEGLTYVELSGMTNSEIKTRLYHAKQDAADKAHPNWEAVHKWL
jgi:transposase